ncbi:hypothetical protein [Clostridium sulfidigenes]|uniref:hypothetical protein n=1 Tax=Clostridium sulfidigenes TaxID=318464 RepID=UPI003F8B31AD
MDFSQSRISYIKSSIKRSYFACYSANEILFDDKELSNASNEIKAAAYINQAISIIESCKALYYSRIEELENAEVEHIFNKFDNLSNEFLNNFSTFHSHQWSNIEFENFKDAVNAFIELP